MIKVKAKECIVELGVKYEPGDVFEISPERAKSLGNGVEIVKEKSIDEPVKDKMIYAPLKKKAVKSKKKK